MPKPTLNYTITPEQAQRRCYLKALRQEITLNSHQDELALSRARINHPAILAYKARILGGCDSYKEYADWTHFLISDYGPRERCLSLGSGIGRVEKYLVTSGFTKQMETIELCADHNKAIRLEDPRIITNSGDLNFMDLEPDSYDFILCHGVLHHLINLEHLLYQLNRALKKTGLLLIYEYVGETRFQFSEARLDFLKSNFPTLCFTKRLLYTVPGFESVRSGELLDLIKAQFGDSCERAIFYGGVYFPFLHSTLPKNDVHVKRVLELDEEVSKHGTLKPCYHMGLYRKSERPMTPAKQWSDAEMELQLSPPVPFKIQIRRALSSSPFGSAVRWGRRVLQGHHGKV